MAFDASVSAAALDAPSASRDHFLRSERLVVLFGASALGVILGFVLAVTVGRQDIWVLTLMALPALGLAAHFTIQTMGEAIAARAWGCATASVLHVGALVAWPMIALFASASPDLFWLAPGMALSALLLFASCWGGSARAVYRASAQAALVAAVAGQQGVMVLLG